MHKVVLNYNKLKNVECAKKEQDSKATFIIINNLIFLF